jgi:WD40 repeat protein
MTPRTCDPSWRRPRQWIFGRPRARPLLLATLLAFLCAAPSQFGVAQVTPNEVYQWGIFEPAWHAQTNGSVVLLGTSAGGAWAFSAYGSFRHYDPNGSLQAISQLDPGNAACLSPNMTLFADTTNLYTMPEVQFLARLEHGPCGISANASLLVTQQGHDVVSWVDYQFRSSYTFDTLPWALSIAPSGDKVAVAYGTRVAILSLPALSVKFDVQPLGVAPLAPGQVLAWSPDSSELAYSYGEGFVRILDDHGALVRTAYGLSGATTLAWSPNGRWMAAGDFAGAVLLWNLSAWTPEAVEVYHSYDRTAISALSFGDDASLYVGTAGGWIDRWYRTNRTSFVDAGPSRSVVVGAKINLEPADIRGFIIDTDCNWTVTGATQLFLPGLVTSFAPSAVGLYNVRLDCVDAYGASSTSAFNLSVYSSDDKPPTVTILSPGHLESVQGVLNASGQATDDVGVIRVEVWVDGAGHVPAGGTENWSLNLYSLTAGSHVLHVQAFDAFRGSSRIDMLFSFQPAPSPNLGSPTLRIEAPIDGAEVKGHVIIKGDGRGPDPLSGVELDFVSYANTAIGTSNWFFDWDTTLVADGWLQVRATISDKDGDKSSQTIRVLVNNTGLSPSRPPVITIRFPADNSSINETGVAVLGTVVDDGDLVSVQIRIDGGRWETHAPTPSFEFPLNMSEYSAGHHVIEVRGLDQWQVGEARVSIQLQKGPAALGPAQDSGRAVEYTGLGPGGVLLGAVLGATTALTVGAILWRSERVKGWPARLRRPAIVTLIAFGLLGGAFLPSLIIAPAQPNTPGSTPDGPGNATAAPSIAPDFTCLGRDGGVITNDQLLGRPVLLYVTRGDFLSEHRTLSMIDQHRNAGPTDAVFLAADVNPVTNASSTQTFLYANSITPWQECQDVYGLWDNYQVSAGALMLISRQGNLTWRPASPSDESWPSAFDGMQ